MDNHEEVYEKPLIQKDSLESRVSDLENIIEMSELFYYSLKVRKRSVEELLEISCIKEFNLSISEFRGTWGNEELRKGGNPGKNIERKQVIEAQQWFMSIMNNVLHRTTFSMQINYPFFKRMKIMRHRPIFLSAVQPNGVGAEYQKNRATFLSIMKRTRQMMREESVFDDALEGF